jgi:D-arabinose 1-dehydrogenase-like Zn-dependent alcohol dehydrogenase
MNHFTRNRRSFLRKSAGIAAVGALTPYVFTAADPCSGAVPSKNDGPSIGCIGVGWMGNRDLQAASQFGQVVAVCDVDRTRAEAASDGGRRSVFGDYRKLLDRKDIGVVTISTPDHWHTRIAMDALKAGKDVYCQKPLTLGTCYVPASEIRAVLRQAVGGDTLSTKHHLCTGS